MMEADKMISEEALYNILISLVILAAIFCVTIGVIVYFFVSH